MQHFHTGRYDLATDKFIGGKVAALVTVPASAEWPIARQRRIEAGTVEELRRLHEQHTGQHGKTTS